MINTLSEKILILVFIVVNITLYYFSYDGATLNEGADFFQYYSPALSFVENGTFIINDEPFVFGTPLYSIFLAIPIFFLGIDNSSVAIVAMQCTLLYFTGFVSRDLLLQFSSKFGILLHALIIFNPNSIITAHLVQSETLFTFLLVCSVFVAFKIIDNFSLKNIILLGFLTGLAALTRPVALYLLLSWPLIILIAMLVRVKLKGNKLSCFDWRSYFIKSFFILFVGGLVVSPWYARNYIEFDKVFFTANSGVYLKDQYIQLKNKGSGQSSIEAQKEHKKIFMEYLDQESDPSFCLDDERHWSCNTNLTHASLNAIFKEPMIVHIKGFIDSWSTLFLSGGASNIRNYLGIEGKNLVVNFQTKSFNGLESIIKLVQNMSFSYLFIFIFTTAFAVISRVIGIVGFFYLFKDRERTAYGLLLIETISIFTAAYLYLGQSRFRVPLEPLLMLLTVVGILYIVKYVKVDE